MSSPDKPKAPTDWQRRKDRLGPRLVSCIVSPRWLEFRDRAFYNDEDYILEFDVMTHGADERPRKLCELLIPQKELEAAIRAIERKPPHDAS